MPKNSLYTIPGFGKAAVRDLNQLGIYELSDLKNKDPETMYLDLEKLQDCHIDRCVLYVFREAVYFAEGGLNPEKLKWWNWKDKDKNGLKNHLCRYRKSKNDKSFGDFE